MALDEKTSEKDDLWKKIEDAEDKLIIIEDFNAKVWKRGVLWQETKVKKIRDKNRIKRIFCTLNELIIMNAF